MMGDDGYWEIHLREGIFWLLHNSVYKICVNIKYTDDLIKNLNTLNTEVRKLAM